MTPAELDALERQVEAKLPMLQRTDVTLSDLRWLISQARRAERAERVVEAARNSFNETIAQANRALNKLNKGM